jgi:hypothetical protein
MKPIRSNASLALSAETIVAEVVTINETTKMTNCLALHESGIIWTCSNSFTD